MHTLDLEKKNHTTDQTINFVSVSQQRIVITKDSDFYDSFLIKQEPYKLILVKLGNMSKVELLKFFADRFDEIIEKIALENILVLTKA